MSARGKMSMDGLNWFEKGLGFFKRLSASTKDGDSAHADNGGSTKTCAEQEPATLTAVELVQADALITEQPIPGPSEGECRREMIRQLFNDFWNGADDKPPTFAERLDAAENYINTRLIGANFDWRLDAATRKQLGLPDSKRTLYSSS